MTSDGQSVERLREYLRNLKPEARALLIAELERAQLRGDDMTGSELVLEELRRTIRTEAQRVPRIGDAARLRRPNAGAGNRALGRPGRLAQSGFRPLRQCGARTRLPGQWRQLPAIYPHGLCRRHPAERARHRLPQSRRHLDRGQLTVAGPISLKSRCFA